MEQIRLKSELDKQSTSCEHSSSKKPVTQGDLSIFKCLLYAQSNFCLNLEFKVSHQLNVKNMKRSDESKHADILPETCTGTASSKFSLRPFVTLKSKVTSSNKLLKRTLSNSMLDLSSNSMNQTCSKQCMTQNVFLIT